jgi:hypothetical protein
MKKKIYVALAVVMAGAIILASAAMGAGTVAKNIKVMLGGIKILVNGKAISSSPEPFIYNGTTYVPIRLVATSLGKVVSWDHNQNAVLINDSAGDTHLSREVSNLKNQLAQREAELAQLKQQNTAMAFRISDLESQVKKYEEEQSKKDAAEELEDYLYDEYSRWKKIDFDYNAKGDEDALDLTIEVDLADFKDEWNDLDEDDIEDWLNDIYDYMDDEYPDADFEGTIVDVDKDEDLVEFYVSGGKLKVKFYDTGMDFDDLEDYLNDEYGSNLDDYDSDFGDMEVDIEIDGDEDYEDIYITITVDTSKYGDEWDDVYGTSAAEDWISDIVKDVQDEYEDYDISGEVEDEDGSTLATFKLTSSGVDITWK